MSEHRIEATLERDGTLTLDGLPFQAGDHVEVTIVPTPEASERRRSLRGTRVTLVDPYVPVAAEDWDAGR